MHLIRSISFFCLSTMFLSLLPCFSLLDANHHRAIIVIGGGSVYHIDVDAKDKTGY